MKEEMDELEYELAFMDMIEPVFQELFKEDTSLIYIDHFTNKKETLWCILFYCTDDLYINHVMGISKRNAIYEGLCAMKQQPTPVRIDQLVKLVAPPVYVNLRHGSNLLSTPQHVKKYINEGYSKYDSLIEEMLRLYEMSQENVARYKLILDGVRTYCHTSEHIKVFSGGLPTLGKRR